MQIDAVGGHFVNSTYAPFPVVKFGEIFDMYFIRGYTDQKDQKTCSLFFLGSGYISINNYEK